MAYTSDEQLQIEEIKTWWKENAKVLIVTLILVIAGVLGWRYYQESQQKAMYATSTAYDLLNENTDNAQLMQFAQQNKDTSYAVFALLESAQKAVQTKDYSQASEALNQALQNTGDDVLRSVIGLRLAAVEMQQKQYEQAKNALNYVKGQAWQSRKLMLSGDIALVQGNRTQAKMDYENAMKVANSPFDLQWLEIRLNNL